MAPATTSLCSLARNGGLRARAQRPNDLSFREKKGLLDFQRKKAHRQTAIFYFRRASGYSQCIHRPLPLPFRLPNCQHPQWAAAALLAGGQPPCEVAQGHRNRTGQRQRKGGLRESSDSTAVDRNGHHSFEGAFFWVKPVFFPERKWVCRCGRMPHVPRAPQSAAPPAAGCRAYLAARRRRPLFPGREHRLAAGGCYGENASFSRSFSMAFFSIRDTCTWLTPTTRADCSWVSPL